MTTMKKTLFVFLALLFLCTPILAFESGTAGSLTTTNATPVTQIVLDLQPGTMWTGMMYVKAIKSDGTAQRVWQTQVAARRLGTATVMLVYGTPQSLNDSALSTTVITPVANGSALAVQLTGIAATTINWYIGFSGDQAP
jgi:hypothetical protein